MSDYSLTKVQKAWGVNQTPYFGDLYKKPEKYKSLFKFREKLVTSIIERIDSHIDSKIILLTGPPGVGKSTILDFLVRHEYKNTMSRISLSSRLSSTHDYGYTQFTVEQFLYIFEMVERFLNDIIYKHNLAQPNTSVSQVRDRYNETNNIPFDEFTRDIILPKCETIQAAGSSIPRYILAIDDVDYLFPYNQNEIMSVLCSMANITLNPLIIYSARPLAASIANTHINSHAHHLTGPSIRVEPLDPYSVIESRLMDSVTDTKTFNSPFKDNETQHVLRKMSNGNLREALNLAQHCYQEAMHYTIPPYFCYSYETILNSLYGTPSPSKDSDIEVEEPRYLINLLRSLEPRDPVPLLYIALNCLHYPCVIDDEFVKKFNDDIKLMNPKEVVGVDISVNVGKVLIILWECHKRGLLRRIEHVDLKEISKNSESYKPQQGLFNHKLCLTEKGALLLQLTSNEHYLQLTAAESWRTGVYEKIRDRKFNVLVPEPTYLYA